MLEVLVEAGFLNLLLHFTHLKVDSSKSIKTLLHVGHAFFVLVLVDDLVGDDVEMVVDLVKEGEGVVFVGVLLVVVLEGEGEVLVFVEEEEDEVDDFFANLLLQGIHL